ncbi:MAG TPA: hypothetical protein VNM66_00745 [Thermodesulfobacteriota bacterium]|nr:hypothetical protein [Thermodesulfobacteriota bacterium]
MVVASVVGLVAGSVLFAAGLVFQAVWATALGLVLVPASVVAGLSGRGG